MQFTLTINGNTAGELSALLAGLNGTTAATSTSTSVAASAKQAAPAPAAKEGKEPKPAAPAAAETSEKITLVQLRAAIEPKVKTNVNGVLAKLKDFGVENISGLSEEQRSLFLAEINAL